jgi:DNA sulfur modification protein DndC
MPDAIAPSFAEETVSALCESYQKDGRPWIVAFSGGKDSTLVLQLVYTMVLELGSAATKPVVVVSSDTQVEAPNVAAHVEAVLKSVEDDAQRRGLPVSVRLVQPAAGETFWAKLIGKGYPPPTRWFRWCTTNMKIKPSRRVIESVAAKHGSVVLLLGSRHAESSARAGRMKGRRVNMRNLNPHTEIPNAFVATPIMEWQTDDVWEYLAENNPPPWGRPHDGMLTLYRQALGGECPVVVDLSTPSCGGSRFGCWVCTVVKADKSMGGFIDSGEEWMRPLAEFRDWLKAFREDPAARQTVRRDGSEGPGPFTPRARERILAELLERERQVGIPLISECDIQSIQAAWWQDFDLGERAFEIARAAGRDIGGVQTVPLSDDDRAMLEDSAAAHGIQPDLVARIMDLEREYPRLDRHGTRTGLRRNLEELIRKALSERGAEV